MGKPHGLDGSFHVTRPRPALLSLDIPVHVGGEPATIVRRAGTDADPILRLAGVDSREAVEALRGADLEVDREHAPALESDEFWAEDLAGLAVVDGGRPVGTVARMLEYPSCELLEVTRPDGPALLVPLVRDAVRSIDVEGGVVDVDLAFLGEE